MLTCPSSTIPNLILFPTRTPVPLRRRNHLGGFFYDDFSNHHKAAFLRGSTCGPRFGFMPGMVPQPDEVLIKDLVDRAEGILYTIADAAVSSSDATNAADSATGKQSGDWLSGITYCMESVLKVLKDGLAALHVPYTYGFAIILLTLIVKAATFPLTRKQVESAMAMRSLQPQVKAIQERFAGDQEKIQLETARLYKLAGINPLAGCLPTLATIPVWIGLYRALSHVADEGLLSEGFFFIPSLAGPTTTAARQNGSGISWLFPFVDGNPPLGWSDTLAYLVLPVLLVITQYISVQIMQSSARNDPNLKNSQLMSKILPLMIGYFSLSVPSGLSLYWLTNNILSTGQQVWLQKLGGAKNPVLQQYNYDFIKEDQSQTRKSPSVLNSSKIEAKQEEKLTPEGLRPGERFKQIKEEEARRRREREEEKRKAEEAALKGKQIANEGPNNEANLFERGNGANSSTAGVVLNGSISGLDTSNDEKIASLISSEEIEVSSNNEISERDERIFSRNEISVRNEQDSASNEVSMIDEQHFHEEKEKEAVEVYDGSDHGRDRQ